MQDEDIRRAEKRVMEMNRMTKQLAEQGSRYIQNNGNDRRRSAFSLPETETRFEPVTPQTVRQADTANQNAEMNRNTRQNSSLQRNSNQNRNNGGQVRQNRRSAPPPKAVSLPMRKAAAGRRKYFPLSGWTANSFCLSLLCICLYAKKPISSSSPHLDIYFCRL